MNLTDLPLELFRAVLAECMLSRSLKRALRLRLVSKFFSREVIGLLGKLRMLDESNVNIEDTGVIGEQYLSQRLLSRNSKLNPILQNLRNIASQFSTEDGDEENYPNYIDIIAVSVVRYSLWPLKSLFGNFDVELDPDRYDLIDHNLAAAAALTGRLELVQQFKGNPFNVMGLLGSTIYNAVEGGNLAIIDHLLEYATHLGPHAASNSWWDMLACASEEGKLDVVEHLLSSSSKWEPRLNPHRFSEVENMFHTALETPSVHIFERLLSFRLETCGLCFSQADLIRFDPLLPNAAKNGWLDMCQHLVNRGTATHGDEVYGHSHKAQPLYSATTSPSPENKAIIELLLNRGAKFDGYELSGACMLGRLDVARLLIEKGAHVVGSLDFEFRTAVQLEHKELFRLLWENCKALTGRGCTVSSRGFEQIVNNQELESMRGFLVDIGAIMEGEQPSVPTDRLLAAFRGELRAEQTQHPQ